MWYNPPDVFDDRLPAEQSADILTDQPPAIRYWHCPNCGQVYFSDPPPDLCDVCQDFTTWQPLNGDRPAQQKRHDHDGEQPAVSQPDDAAENPNTAAPSHQDDQPASQPPLFGD
jgi:rubredoxin